MGTKLTLLILPNRSRIPNEENASNKDIIQNKQEGKINENTKGTNNSCKSNVGQQLSNKKDSKKAENKKHKKPKTGDKVKGEQKKL